MKYIVFEVTQGTKEGELKREIPVIFPESLVHMDVRDALISSCDALKRAKVVSAGFLSSMSFRGECGGFSETLNAKSRGKKDDDLISTMDYFHGLVE